MCTNTFVFVFGVSKWNKAASFLRNCVQLIVEYWPQSRVCVRLCRFQCLACTWGMVQGLDFELMINHNCMFQDVVIVDLVTISLLKTCCVVFLTLGCDPLWVSSTCVFPCMLFCHDVWKSWPIDITFWEQSLMNHLYIWQMKQPDKAK